MLKRYIAILIIMILIVVFAIQNVDTIEIRLLMFNINASLSLVIIITVAISALVTLLFAYQELRIRNKRIKELEDKINNPENEFDASAPDHHQAKNNEM